MIRLIIINSSHTNNYRELSIYFHSRKENKKFRIVENRYWKLLLNIICQFLRTLNNFEYFVTNCHQNITIFKKCHLLAVNIFNMMVNLIFHTRTFLIIITHYAIFSHNYQLTLIFLINHYFLNLFFVCIQKISSIIECNSQ